MDNNTIKKSLKQGSGSDELIMDVYITSEEERMMEQIVEDIKTNLETEDVAICIEAKHMCMVARGVKKTNAQTISSKFTGKFEEDTMKNEFYNLIK